jgi:hypothetical protein
MAHSCPKCGKAMAEGFVLDQSHGARLVSHWHAGKPVKSLWLGLKLPATKHPIESWRCTACGFLEHYARS